ncbi:hypothetical protein N7U66_08215 [Lacinutrix neustonica]|uniref:DUF4412 domain-containing protein n=1 Tax=Lacinutrix neustonica TaxID=2980107 RepID=A0A9E8MYY6_9FLAO|nr:hypothetical protein [Lacinutrix neustonica]WAC03460.1 hypothetical protein N7U66_08215 [Lacinutrix neustonica]
MRHLKTIALILTLCFATQADAQIFKKLGKKISKVTEKTFEKKAEQKTEKETNKAFDSTFNNGSKNNKTKNGKQKNSSFGMSNVAPADTYKFSHKYTMQIDDGKSKTDLDYFLTNQGEYLGFMMPDDRQKLFTVIDMPRSTLYMLMENKGDKTQMAMDMKFDDVANDAFIESDYSITPTGRTKTMLGYLANEYAVKGKDMHGTIWVTNEANVTFTKLYAKTKVKKGLDQMWLKMIDGLPLEMNITDTSKRKAKNMTMRCIALEKTSFSIDTSDYKKIM